MSTLNSFRKKGRKKPSNPLLAFKQTMQKDGLIEGQKVIFNPDGEVKMSEVLTEFIKPYMKRVNTVDEHRKLLVIAVLAWNAAILPEEKRQEMVNTLLANLQMPDDKDFRSIIEMMIERKMKHFAEIRRLIVNFELTDLGSSTHLSVASTLDKDEETAFSQRQRRIE